MVGFDLAFTYTTEELVGTSTLLVPTAPVLAFLKMRAWLDRPEMRKKDLADIAHLLCEYIGDDDERRWHDDVVALGLDFRDVSPYVLGRDLGRIMRDEHELHVREFLRAAVLSHR
ncbi:MAG: hypothetical protein JRH11_22175, partial [Deltaproteobacteria bacterium]|nr:hypothetical protein [Deltaproteobacteria bacterium]